MSRVIDRDPPDGFVECLSRFRGVVCDYQFFSLAGSEPPSAEDLRVVARRTVERTLKQVRAKFPTAYTNLADPDRPFVNAERLAQAVPAVVGWDEFLGPNWYNDVLVAPDHSGVVRPSYLRAFEDPPYGIDLREQTEHSPWWRRFLFGPPKPSKLEPSKYLAEFIRLRNQVLEIALGAKVGSKHVTIWEMAADWSIYFDEGHEWWGSYCWTIWTQPDRLVGIVASTTD